MAEEDSEGIPGGLKNPFRQRPVIRCILQYLNLQDVKNCRYVSDDWNSEAKIILRTRSRISLKPDRPYGRLVASKRNPSKFFEEFSDTLDSMPFTAFKISFGFIGKVTDLNDFFQRQQGTIRELTIEDLRLVNEDNSRCIKFDITAWISSTPITQTDTKFQTKLEIESTVAVLQSCALANVKELSLSSCRVILQNQIKLHPIKLKLENVTFFRDGVSLSELCINDLIDFSRVKSLHLDSSDATKLSFDLNANGKLSLEYLFLSQITVENWNTCQWEVNKLELPFQSFVEKTKMLIRELKFSWGAIDVSALPKSLKRLTVEIVKEVVCSDSQKVILDDLRYLKCSYLGSDNLAVVLKSINCSNMVEVHLEAKSERKINSDWIPKSTKILRLFGVAVNGIEASQDFKLDKLVLGNYSSFNKMKKIFGMLLQTKELILHFSDDSYQNMHDFVVYLRSRNCSEHSQYIYAGPFVSCKRVRCTLEEDEEEQESPLASYVDRKARYYVFENHVGKAISDKEFQILLRPKAHMQ